MNPFVFHTPSLQIAHQLHNKAKAVACHTMVTNLQHKLFQIWLFFFVFTQHLVGYEFVVSRHFQQYVSYIMVVILIGGLPGENHRLVASH